MAARAGRQRPGTQLTADAGSTSARRPCDAACSGPSPGTCLSPRSRDVRQRPRASAAPAARPVWRRGRQRGPSGSSVDSGNRPGCRRRRASQVPQAQASQQPQGQAYPPRVPAACSAAVQQPVQQGGVAPTRPPTAAAGLTAAGRATSAPAAAGSAEARRRLDRVHHRGRAAGARRRGRCLLGPAPRRLSVGRRCVGDSQAWGRPRRVLSPPRQRRSSSSSPRRAATSRARSRRSATCGIAELANKPAPVDGCDGTVGYVARVTADAVSVDCTAPADQPKPAASDVPVLEYGARKKAEGFTCTSERDRDDLHQRRERQGLHPGPCRRAALLIRRARAAPLSGRPLIAEEPGPFPGLGSYAATRYQGSHAILTRSGRAPPGPGTARRRA